MHTTEGAPAAVLTRADLLGLGLRPRQITRAVRDGALIRVRRDRYMSAADADTARAVRVGGRLGCVTVLARCGVFVLDGTRLHVHLERSMSRLRRPDEAGQSLRVADRAALRLHWWPLRATAAGLGTVDLVDALAQAIRCQDARSAVATVDSVLQLGVLSMADVHDVFAGLPRRYRIILRLADASAESGSETFMRLLLRQLGLRYRTQVSIDGVGRVDFLVEGWLIIECDSKAHHEGWEKQKRDRRRDLAAAQRGFTTLRPLAEDLFFDRGCVAQAVRGLVAVHHRRR